MASESLFIPRPLLIQLEQAASNYDSKNETAAQQARELLEAAHGAQVSPEAAAELQKIEAELREELRLISSGLAKELRAIAVGDRDTMADELMGVAYRLERESLIFLPKA